MMFQGFFEWQCWGFTEQKLRRKHRSEYDFSVNFYKLALYLFGRKFSHWWNTRMVSLCLFSNSWVWLHLWHRASWCFMLKTPFFSSFFVPKILSPGKQYNDFKFAVRKQIKCKLVTNLAVLWHLHFKMNRGGFFCPCKVDR